MPVGRAPAKVKVLTRVGVRPDDVACLGVGPRGQEEDGLHAAPEHRGLINGETGLAVCSAIEGRALPAHMLPGEEVAGHGAEGSHVERNNRALHRVFTGNLKARVRGLNTSCDADAEQCNREGNATHLKVALVETCSRQRDPSERSKDER